MDTTEEKLKALRGILEEALDKVKSGDLDGAEKAINKIDKISTCALCAETQIFFLSLIYVSKFPIGDDERKKRRLKLLIEELEYFTKELGEDNGESVYRGSC